MRLLRVAALSLFVATVHLHAQVETRDPLPVPDLPGYWTLKADLHLHSVFSDGVVWPTVHVREAWRDGLDVVSEIELTNMHAEPGRNLVVRTSVRIHVDR